MTTDYNKLQTWEIMMPLTLVADGVSDAHEIRKGYG